MAVKYGKFQLPQRITIDQKSATSRFAQFVAEPFERGFGHTLGNALRRMMLSSLEAPAIVSVKIEGISHEYMAVEGIVEDMVNIILNFKGALLRQGPSTDDSKIRIPRLISTVLTVTQDDLDRNEGHVSVTLGDVMKEGTFGVVNPELHLFTVTKPLTRQVDLRVAIGRGYVPSERHVIREKASDEILVDAAFSPVRLVNYIVENTRVGQDTDFDRLIMEVHTDGRVTPVEALSYAAQIGEKHFDVFTSIQEEKLNFEIVERKEDSDYNEIMEKLCLRIDEIELSVRSTNCLSGANIETIGQLVTTPERKMLEFKNFGKKSLTEIREKLHEMELYLGMDLAAYGLTPENIQDRIRHHLEERKEKRKEAPKTTEEKL